jgi:Transglycosylase-like domain
MSSTRWLVLMAVVLATVVIVATFHPTPSSGAPDPPPKPPREPLEGRVDTLEHDTDRTNTDRLVVDADVAKQIAALNARIDQLQAALETANQAILLLTSVRTASAPVPPRPNPAPPGPTTHTVTSTSGRNYQAMAQCESGGDWSYNGPSGFDGGLQFLPSTWIAAGGGEFAPYAYLATPQQQMIVADRLPLTAWPVCGTRA